MDPGIRFVIIAVGALLGLGLGQVGTFWNLIIGACLGLALGEVRALRIAIRDIENEIEQLRSRSSERPTSPPVRKAAPPETAPELPQAAFAEAPAAASAEPAHRLARPLDGSAPSDPLAPYPPARRPERAAASPENPLVAAIRGFFTGGNTLVRVGIVVLFFGVAFLLRYAAEHSHLPIELRLSGVALGAVVLLALGWRLRRRRSGYAFALQGGGVGILYLTVFAAFRLYNVLPQSIAFLVLVLVAALAAGIAILQNSQSFALLGVSGGFLAPVLASTGTGSHVALFGYFLVLDGGIALVAWFKSWRPLNLAGFVFTFAIATTWGVLKYRPEDFSSTEPFLVAFFLLFVGVAVLYALRQPLKLRGYVDSTLVFGTPIVVFGLQTGMLHQNSMALAYSALVLSGFYLLLSFVVQRWHDPKQRPLFESFIALAVVFLTLAIPLALGNRLNSAAWALEGAGVVYIGCRQHRKLARAFGTVLILAAALLLVPEVHAKDMHWELPWGSYAAVVVVSIACMTAVRMLESALAELNELETLYRPVLFCVGILSWCVGSLGELPHLALGAALLSAAVAFLAASALVLSEASRRAALPFAAGCCLLLLPFMVVLAGASFFLFTHPSEGGGWLAWPVAFACVYLLAWRHEGGLGASSRRALHVAALWLLCVLLAADCQWLIKTCLAAQGDWAACSVLVVPALVLLALPKLSNKNHWPFAAHRDSYRVTAGAAIAVVLGGACLWLNVALAGDASPLSYLPIINPLDVVELLSLLALFNYARSLQAAQRLAPARAASILAGLTFVWCNGVVLRTLHHLLGIPYSLEALAASNVVQTTITIFWSVLALVTMLVASLRRHRAPWLVGAGLLVVVIAKLFFVDLSSVGSIARIISFVGVGLLMLIVGYFSPLPPRARETS